MSTHTVTPMDEKKKGSLLIDPKIEGRLNIKDLEHLQEAFSLEGDGYNNQLSLTREQFIEALTLILNKGTREEYGSLFDKIDVAKEGNVDWNKLASHMLLEFYEKDDKVRSNLLPQWKDIRTIPGPHKDCIQRVSFIKNIGRYIVISKEGNVSLYGQDMKLQRTAKTTTDTCRTRDLWITDFAPMQNIGKVALSFTSKEIGFYDMNAKLDLNCQFKLTGLEATPICLDYWFNSDNHNEAILLWGDVTGHINIVFWTSACIALFERPPAQQDKEGKAKRNFVGTHLSIDDAPNSRFEISSKTSMSILLSDISKGIYKTSRFLRHPCHEDWVRKIRFLPNLECFISCATTWNSSMVIGWMEKHASSGMQSSVAKTYELLRKLLSATRSGNELFGIYP